MNQPKHTEEYKDNDILEVELQPYVQNYSIPNYENPKVPFLIRDKKTLEITGQALNKIMVDIEDLNGEYDSCKQRHLKAKARMMLRLRSEGSFSDDELEASLNSWAMSNSPERLFFEQEGRTLKPLKAVRILKNKGARANDLQAQHDRRLETDELMKQALIKFLAESKTTKKA